MSPKVFLDILYSNSFCLYHIQGSDEEDCYADILKDDIIKLDESTAAAPTQGITPPVPVHYEADRKPQFLTGACTPTALPFQRAVGPDSVPQPVNYEPQRQPQHMPGTLASDSLPFQGTANRRIRLKKLEPTTKELMSEERIHEFRFRKISVRNRSHQVVSVIFLVSLLVFFVSLLDGFSLLKRVSKLAL